MRIRIKEFEPRVYAIMGQFEFILEPIATGQIFS